MQLETAEHFQMNRVSDSINYSRADENKQQKHAKNGVSLDNKRKQQQQSEHVQQQQFGLAIYATTIEQLEQLQQFCTANYISINCAHCLITDHLQYSHLQEYVSTACNAGRSEYALALILIGINFTITNNQLEKLVLPVTTTNKKVTNAVRPVLQLLQQHSNESLNHFQERLINYLLSTINHKSSSLYYPELPQFVQLPSGANLTCWHRPSERDLPLLRQLGTTHILTLLGQQEQLNTLINAVKSAGMYSLYCDLDGANQAMLSSKATLTVIHHLLHDDQLYSLLQQSNTKLLVHCAAGVHRTGTIIHLLLRFCAQLTIQQSHLALLQMRRVTAAQVGTHRIELVERFLLPQLQLQIKKQVVHIEDRLAALVVDQNDDETENVSNIV
ncbi:unnamed protein product [Didymodactylos carnosus]|uniref:Tyrosine specific protein phosphatases domain-containing protein n=1 Tax=Didymodactylos carnosus TaxID=1234261 RepID=A0A814STM4_9BILA|nr:unnamed protein product [Didymodactylos carnosus]CAF3915257.1 unnamed protein product [Didymodactylos carnosus]